MNWLPLIPDIESSNRIRSGQMSASLARESVDVLSAVPTYPAACSMRTPTSPTYDLVFQNAGHVIFGFFGQLIGVLGRSIIQVPAPAVCTAVFLARTEYGSAAGTLFWTGQSFFFFNDTATTEIYTLSLHDALPI